jgi:hypothetical protein
MAQNPSNLSTGEDTTMPTPVMLIGWGQATQPKHATAPWQDPVDLIEKAARDAAAKAGVGALAQVTGPRAAGAAGPAAVELGLVAADAELGLGRAGAAELRLQGLGPALNATARVEERVAAARAQRGLAMEARAALVLRQRPPRDAFGAIGNPISFADRASAG